MVLVRTVSALITAFAPALYLVVQALLFTSTRSNLHLHGKKAALLHYMSPSSTENSMKTHYWLFPDRKNTETLVLLLLTNINLRLILKAFLLTSICSYCKFSMFKPNCNLMDHDLVLSSQYWGKTRLLYSRTVWNQPSAKQETGKCWNKEQVTR